MATEKDPTFTVIQYIPNSSDRGETLAAILKVAKEVEGRAKTRCLYPGDAEDLLDLIARHDEGRIFRSYSADGFVANSYDYPAEISVAEAVRQEDGSLAITVFRVRAQRSHGEGSLLTVDGKREA